MSWEYKVEDRYGCENAYTLEQWLNKLGDKGWELVSIRIGSDTPMTDTKAIFKRQSSLIGGLAVDIAAQIEAGGFPNNT